MFSPSFSIIIMSIFFSSHLLFSVTVLLRKKKKRYSSDISLLSTPIFIFLVQCLSCFFYSSTMKHINARILHLIVFISSSFAVSLLTIYRNPSTYIFQDSYFFIRRATRRAVLTRCKSLSDAGPGGNVYRIKCSLIIRLSES